LPQVVLDASAVLAVVLEEPGAGVVVEALRSGAAMSTVNVAEVAARLHQDGWTGPECVAFSEKALAKLQPLAAAHHDAWERCSPRVRKLHARNVAVIGGAGITEPVSAVVCWTEDGRVEGGTGLAIRLAEAAGIPVFNLASVHPRDVCLAMNRIAWEARASDAA